MHDFCFVLSDIWQQFYLPWSVWSTEISSSFSTVLGTFGSGITSSLENCGFFLIGSIVFEIHLAPVRLHSTKFVNPIELASLLISTNNSLTLLHNILVLNPLWLNRPWGDLEWESNMKYIYLFSLSEMYCH